MEHRKRVLLEAFTEVIRLKLIPVGCSDLEQPYVKSSVA